VRSWGAEPASWWHLTGIAAAALTWLLWPTVPETLSGAGTLPGTTSRSFCYGPPTTADEADCLRRMTQAVDIHDLVWWSTGALILIAALLARRARIAAWAAIPCAFAGCEVAAYFLNQPVLSLPLDG
jgi:pimeloyl-ACP methyl ester carboxylesterase